MPINFTAMREQKNKSLASGNQLILDHPVLAVVIAGFMVLMLAGALPSTLYEPGKASTWVTIVVLVVIVYAAAMAFGFPRVVRMRPDEVVSLSWAFAISPALIAFLSAFLFGTPRWVPGFGYVISLAALIGVTRLAVLARDQRAGSDDSQAVPEDG